MDVRAGGGEDGDEDAEVEAGAELVGNVDEAGGGTCAFARSAGDAGGGERPEGGALADADQDHRERDAGQVRRVRRDAAEPGHTDEALPVREGVNMVQIRLVKSSAASVRTSCEHPREPGRARARQPFAIQAQEKVICRDS